MDENREKMACVSIRTQIIMSIFNKKFKNSDECSEINRFAINKENTPPNDNSMFNDDFHKSVGNKELLILDIPEVTTGLSTTEFEIQDYFNPDTDNCISQISSVELLSSSENFHTMTNLVAVPCIDSEIIDNSIQLAEYEKEVGEFPVTADHEMEMIIFVEDRCSKVTEKNNVDRTGAEDTDFEVKSYTEESPDHITTHEKEASLDSSIEKDEHSPAIEENEEVVANVNDPDFEPDFELNNDSGNETIVTKKRKKRQFVCTEDWNVNRKKIKRESGQEYYGRKKVDGKWKYDIKKDARKLKEPCNCKPSIKGKLLKCRMFSEEERNIIFTQFWTKMGWKERKVYVSFLVDSQPTKRSRNRVAEGVSRRSESLVYYLKHNEERIRVCKQMFLNTHCVKENMILDWIKQRNVIDDNTKEKTKNDEHVKLGRYKDMKDKLTSFLTELPKMESHYCRASSTKQYLEPNWASKSSLYIFYKNWCKEKKEPFLSIASFSHVFDQMNLSLFRPKKDESDKCVAHKTGNLSADEFALQEDKKKEARTEKAKDIESGNKLFCMDVQSVLLSPKSNVSSLYFKTKLKVHNLSFFDVNTKDGYCYIWHESSGGVLAQDYSSIICQFIKDHGTVQPGQTLILYSDGCTSQNRNATLTNALINMSITLNITIEQKYLEKGHTQMEADSINSTIERQLRHTNINVPADYVELIMKARKNPRPYRVYYLGYGFFKDFRKQKFLSSLRPGKTVGDPVVTDIRALKYTPDSSLFYKLRHPEEFVEMKYSRLSKKKLTELACPLNNLPALYEVPTPIKKSKYLDLQFKKKSLNSDYHSFYDHLPYK